MTDGTGRTNGFVRRDAAAGMPVEDTFTDAPLPFGSRPAAGPALEGAEPETGGSGSCRTGEIRNVIECLLLARGGILRIGEIKKVLEVPEPEIRATLAALAVEYGGRGLQIQEIAGGYQLCTRPEYGAHVQRLLRLGDTDPLTRATLEVLAIVAYRQPITRAEVDMVRGVQSVHHLLKLQDRRLIREVGRRPGPGRPILYGTTEGFLRYFGLRDLESLPNGMRPDGPPELPRAVR